LTPSRFGGILASVIRNGGDPMKGSILACLAVALVALGCGGGGGGDDGRDTATDPDVTGDTAMDTSPEVTVDTLADTAPEVTEDTIEDAVEEELPASCEGDDSLVLEFLYPDGSPVAGVPAALSCLGEQRTAPSGPGGLVTFGNLDLSHTVDFTFVHESTAYTVVGAGGTRELPEPLTFVVDDPEAAEPDPVPMEGDIVRSTADSWVAIASYAPHWVQTQQDRYEVYTPEETDLTLVAIEYTSDGDTAVPLGYLIVDYDAPTGGADGPTLDFTSPDGTLDSVEVTVDYDLVADSPLTDFVLPVDAGAHSTRLSTGLRIVGYDELDRFMMYGLTMSWTSGTSDVLDVAYIAEGVTASTSIAGELILEDEDRNYLYLHNLSTDPATWTSVTVHDLPQLPGLDVSTPVYFATEIPVSFPSWTDAVMQYHIREQGFWGVLDMSEEMRWNVTVHPETASFTFDDLPWPDSVAWEDVLPPASYRFGAIASHYEDDPYVDYRLWDDEWSDANWFGFGNDSRYRIITP
jgi:hypothetical protein